MNFLSNFLGLINFLFFIFLFCFYYFFFFLKKRYISTKLALNLISLDDKVNESEYKQLNQSGSLRTSGALKNKSKKIYFYLFLFCFFLFFFCLFFFKLKLKLKKFFFNYLFFFLGLRKPVLVKHETFLKKYSQSEGLGNILKTFKKCKKKNGIYFNEGSLFVTDLNIIFSSTLFGSEQRTSISYSSIKNYKVRKTTIVIYSSNKLIFFYFLF